MRFREGHEIIFSNRHEIRDTRLFCVGCKTKNGLCGEDSIASQQGLAIWNGIFAVTVYAIRRARTDSSNAKIQAARGFPERSQQ